MKETFNAKYILHAANSSEALLLAGKHKDIDVVLLDLMIPGMDGLMLLPELASVLKSAKFVIVTGKEVLSVEDINITQENSELIVGIIPKSTSFNVIRESLKQYFRQEIEEVIERVRVFKTKEFTIKDNLCLLTKKQKEILRLLAIGKTNKEIGKKVFLSEGTVKNYVSAILKILGVNNRTEAGYLFKN